jgi:Ca2+/Na+ antiporter
VAYHHLVLGGGPIHLSVSPLEVEDILKWGYRLLYLQLFIFVIMSMFYFDNLVTFAYLGAILSLFYVAMVWKRYTGEKEEGEVPESN